MLRKAKAESTPGPNGISYKAYKKYPKFLNRLRKPREVIWRKGRIPPDWQVADGLLCAKGVELEDHVFQDHIIPQCGRQDLCNDYKTTSYIVESGYIGVERRNSRIPRMLTGHQYIISQLIKEAKGTKWTSFCLARSNNRIQYKCPQAYRDSASAPSSPRC